MAAARRQVELLPGFFFLLSLQNCLKLFLVLQTADKVNTLIEIESFCIKERPQGYFNCDVVR